MKQKSTKQREGGNTQNEMADVAKKTDEPMPNKAQQFLKQLNCIPRLVLSVRQL